jgi:hypothetical protein
MPWAYLGLVLVVLVLYAAMLIEPLLCGERDEDEQ